MHSLKPNHIIRTIKNINKTHYIVCMRIVLVKTTKNYIL